MATLFRRSFVNKKFIRLKIEVDELKMATYEQEKMSVKDGKLVGFTAPFDPRFPNQNQTRYCYQSYLDYHRCQKVKGVDYEPCNYFLKAYKSICPLEWHTNWDTQREEGNFPGKI